MPLNERKMPDANGDAEKLIAQTLYRGARDGSIRLDAKSLLEGYEWCDPVCAAIYISILGLPDDPKLIRELLPAKLTRMGFPEVEWEEFFGPPTLSREEAIRLMRQMRELAL